MRMSGFCSWTADTISSRLVSEKRYSPSSRMPRRWARSLICRSDSSPDTYKTLENRHRLSQICSIKVDFPMPGAPPTSTREPFTAPPPSTRSSSFIPVLKRSSSTASTSAMGLGLRPPSPAEPEAWDFFFASAAGCSTMVFHFPQAGHLPCHFRTSFPHCVQ